MNPVATPLSAASAPPRRPDSAPPTCCRHTGTVDRFEPAPPSPEAGAPAEEPRRSSASGLAFTAASLSMLAALGALPSSGVSTGASLVPPPAAYSEMAPTVSYAPRGGPVLLYGNNPEQITAADLADARFGGHTLYRESLDPGRYRSFFEHLNRTPHWLGFGVRLYNPGREPVEVRLGGQGFVASHRGGEPFRQALADTDVEVRSLPPGGTLYVQRHDDAIAPLRFFSGVADFEVRGGRVIMDHLAYTDLGRVPGSLDYVGYVQRREPDGTREARMYKGLSPHSEVGASGVDFTLDDTTGNGTLPVRYRTYDLERGEYREPETFTRGWTTHIGPGQGDQAVTRDMLRFETPRWGTIDPLRPSDGVGEYPNLGNWGATHTFEGKVTNRGTKARVVSLDFLANPHHGANFAWQFGQGPWQSASLGKGERFTYGAVLVPPGQSRPYRVSVVLGGPSGGALRQFVTVGDAAGRQ